MAYDKCYVTMRVVDAYGRTKTKRVDLVATDAALAETAAATVIGAFASVMEGHIASATISGMNDYAGAAAAGSNVDTGVTVSCQLAGRPERAPLKWPTPDPAIFNGDATLNLGNAAVQAVEALFVTATPAIATISDGETIDSFLSGKLDK
jgi:hypothetical protein